MSHTNSTTNYNLPQFVGSDKPAWLGDINPAMSAIDTAIKNASDAATTASTGTTSNTSAIGTLSNLTTTEKSNLVGAVNEVNSTLGTTVTQVGTNTGDIGNLQSSVNGVSSDLNSFMTKFNLNNITSCDYAPTGITGDFSGIKLAQNSDGSVFKCYGSGYLRNNTNSNINLTTTTQVTGLSGVYGIKTNLKLNTAPSSAYVVSGCGTHWVSSTYDGSLRRVIEIFNFAVDSAGYIWIFASTDAHTWQINTTSALRYTLAPCIYFNTDFGDEPTPDA